MIDATSLEDISLMFGGRTGCLISAVYGMVLSELAVVGLDKTV